MKNMPNGISWFMIMLITHFHDKEHGEWFGYLHRDGTIAQTAKGNLFKGPFHLPRQEWYCWKLLEEDGHGLHC